MKCLVVILGLFWAHQTVIASALPMTGKLSVITKSYLRSGAIFELKIPATGENNLTEHIWASLKEINGSPELIKESQSIVQKYHGINKVIYLDGLLELERVADSLELELLELEADTAPVIYFLTSIKLMNRDASYKSLDKSERGSSKSRRRWNSIRKSYPSK